MDITVKSTPNIAMNTRAIRMEKGIVKEAIKELRRFHMKKIITRTIRIAPSRMEIST
jgi:hypothetical protein